MNVRKLVATAIVGMAAGLGAVHAQQQEKAPPPAEKGQPGPKAHDSPATTLCCPRHPLLDCDTQWLVPWKCEELELKPVQRPCSHYCGLSDFVHKQLWCCQEESKEGADEKGPATPLMQALHSCAPGLAGLLDCHKTTVYGWVQQGITFNFDSPNDRLNFGTNFNNRSNEYRLNQIYLAIERALEHKDEVTIGYRLDFLAGHDAPFLAAGTGLFDDFTGGSFNSIGIDLPQFYLDVHVPGVITQRGVDVRVGRFYTLHGNELIPALSTRFYSHSYGYFYSWPFTHTGVLVTLHLTDTIDVMNGIVRGWEHAFDDNNSAVAWHGMIIWTSCDKKRSFWFTWITGPEQDDNTGNFRTLITYDYSVVLGSCDQWQYVLHGANAWEANALPRGQDAEWYDYAVNLFYTVDPRLILGLRAEVFRDDDGVRTGFADNFFEITTGVTWKPYKNLWIRPEIRFDWSDQTRPFNDQQDKFQATVAVDAIWSF